MKKLSAAALLLLNSVACHKDAATPPPTPPAETPVVRFIAVGDTGKGNEEQLKVAAAMKKKCDASGCDFVVMLGDNIYPSGVESVDDPQWKTKFEDPYAGISAPFFPVLGNHDYGGQGAGNEPAKGQIEVDYSERSQKWRMAGKYWHLRQKHVELFGTDTNSMLYEDDAKQRREMAAWLSASDATWKLALGHHPYLSNGPHGNAGHYDQPGTEGTIFDGHEVKAFLDDVVCGKADVYFSGHDHVKMDPTEGCKNTQLFVSGTGAEPTELKGTNPVRFQSTTLGFAYVVADGPNLTVEFYDDQDTLEYSRTITK